MLEQVAVKQGHSVLPRLHPSELAMSSVQTRLYARTWWGASRLNLVCLHTMFRWRFELSCYAKRERHNTA